MEEMIQTIHCKRIKIRKLINTPMRSTVVLLKMAERSKCFGCEKTPDFDKLL